MRWTGRSCLLAIWLSCISVPTAPASEEQPRPDPASQPAPIWRPALFGALGGALGFAAGGMLGAAHRDGQGDDISGAVYGAIGGQTFGLSFGTWIGNHERGYWPLDLLVSTSLLVGGLWASDQSDPNELEVSLFFVAQLGLTLVSEKWGESRRF
jgi:hypothetical protein